MIRTEIVDAIHTTQHFNPVYWAKTLQQRAGLNENGDINEHRAGSYYPDYNSTQLEAALLMAFWEPFHSDHVRPIFKTFTTPLPGLLGIVELRNLSPTTNVMVRDPKKTGFAQLHYQSNKEEMADETTIIVSKKYTSWKVVTFYPGKPIEGKKIPIEEVKSESISVKNALEIGFTHAKLVKIGT